MLGIAFSPKDLEAAIERVNALDLATAFTLESLDAQTALETELRKLLISIPNQAVKSSEHADYLKLVRGEDPPAGVVSFVQRKKRQLRISDVERIEIERRQMGRCASCGVFLSQEVSPHVDHIRPIALGGDDHVQNMQVLCEACNLGKGDLLHWVMAAPWFIWGEPEITRRLRYCVLARCRSRCSFDECTHDSTTSELRVAMRISKAYGGRPVFDNLYVLCAEHDALVKKRLEDRARASLRSIKSPSGRPRVPVMRVK